MNKSLPRVIARISTVVPAYIAPSLFIIIGEASFYGEILSIYAVLQLVAGWIFNSAKKTFVYAEAHDNSKYMLKTYILFLSMISVLVYPFCIFLEINVGLYAIVLGYLFVETLTIGFLEAHHFISLSIVLKACLFTLSATFVAIFSKIFIIKPSVIFTFSIGIFLLILIFTCTYLVNTRSNQGRSDSATVKEISSEFFINCFRLLPLEAEVTFVAQLPIVLVSKNLGVDSVTFFKLIQSIVRVPAFYQGYTNPYFSSELRKLKFSSKDFMQRIVILFKRRTYLNSVVGVGIFLLACIVLYSNILIHIPLFEGKLQNVFAYRHSILAGLTCYLLITLCGPVTTTLLRLKKAKLLSNVSIFSSLVGIVLMFLTTFNFTMDLAILVSLVPATISNMISRYVIERIFSSETYPCTA